MSKFKQTFANGLITVIISQVLVKILGLVYRIVTTNLEGFGDAGNGFYGAAFRIYVVIIALSVTGISSSIAKLVSERLAKGQEKSAYKTFKIALKMFAGIGGTVALLVILLSRTNF